MERDPLYAVELACVLEESTAMLRHDVRNRLGSIRNMAFYLRRKLSDTDSARADERIGEFFGKIEGEIEWIGELIDAWGARVKQTYVPRARSVGAAQVLELALQSARLPAQVQVDAEFGEGSLSGDPLELALAIRCLLENAAEAAREKVSLKGRASPGGYRIVIENDGRPFSEPKGTGTLLHSEKPGRLGLGLRMVRRIAARYGSSLSVDSQESGARLCLEIPN
jgi:signal transduction histidine kinase